MRSSSVLSTIVAGAVVFAVVFGAAMLPDASAVCVAAEPAGATVTLDGVRVSLSRPVLVARSKRYLWFPTMTRLSGGDLFSVVSTNFDAIVQNRTAAVTWSGQRVDILAHHNATHQEEPIRQPGHTTSYTEIVAADDSHLIYMYDRVPDGWNAIPAGSADANSIWVVRVSVGVTSGDKNPPVTVRRTLEKLKAGQPVTVVCLGDSVTGVYYHTGGRRAYPEMLGLALKAACAQARVTAVNAGISGNTTSDGLKRLQKDVLDRKPDLVTVMFGLNDMVRVPIADFQANLGQIIERCRAAGAEVLLCTPNSVIDTPGRPIPKLIQYCGAIKETASKHQVPICDVYATYDALRTRDPLSWRLLMSDEIHPNMDGHKLNAETICRAITGQEVSLKPAPPPQPALPKTLSVLKAGRPLRVLAMAPCEKWIGPALKAIAPSAKVEVKIWPTEGQTLAQIEAAARAVRSSPPDLVVAAVPAAVTPSAHSPAEEAIRSHSWILNWSLSFGLQQWDLVAIAPSVLQSPLTAEDKSRDAFSRRMIVAQDLNLIARDPHDPSPPERILENWFRAKLAERLDPSP